MTSSSRHPSVTQSHSTASFKMALAMVLSGAIGVLVVESGQSSQVAVFYRCVFGVLILAPFVMFRTGVPSNVRVPITVALMMLTGCTMAANWLLFFEAYRHASISTVTVVYHVYPFALLAGGAMFFGEKVPRRSWVLAAFALVGVFLIVQPNASASAMDVTGFALTVGAMLCYTATLLIMKKLSGIPAAVSTLTQLLVAALIMLPLLGDIPFDLGARAWVCLIVLGIVNTGLLYVLLYSAIVRLRTSSAALLSFLYPATALLVDMFFYDTQPNLIQLTGMFLVLVTVLSEKLG